MTKNLKRNFLATMNEQQLPPQLGKFNLETMSGVFPGTRTGNFHILALTSTPSSVVHEQKNQRVWAKVFWFEDPPEVVVINEDEQVVARIENLNPEKVFEEIEYVIKCQHQWLISCGTCEHWLPTSAAGEAQQNEGHCVKTSGRHSRLGEPDSSAQPSTTGKLASELSIQSAWTLSCPFWENRSEKSSTREIDEEIDSFERSSSLSDFGSASKTDVDLASLGLNVHTWRRRLNRWLGINRNDPHLSAAETASGGVVRFSIKQLDRSGVGAGTEPCLGCHGRIGNLGALVVDTPEGDKQTYSVWRCRNCRATYLNSWIDRWERLDNLETEEKLYRVAPHEALHLLGHMYLPGAGDQPKQRAGQSDDRAWFEAFLHDRTPLSHQVRRGR